MSKSEAEQRVDRACAVLNGFWRRRDAAKRDVERYGALDPSYAVIVGSDRTTAGEIVTELKEALAAAEGEDREALAELYAALSKTAHSPLTWTDHDGEAGTHTIVDHYRADVHRCGERGWRLTVTIETAPARGVLITEAAGFASRADACNAGEACIYACRRG